MVRSSGALALFVWALVQVTASAGPVPTYGPRRTLPVTIGSPRFAATADVNCDGLEDAIVLRALEQGNPPTVPVTILVADAHGGFVDGTSQVIVGSVPRVRSPHRPVLADFNNDGHADVFIPDSGTDTYPNDGFQNTLLLSTADCHLADGTSRLPQQQDATYMASAADVDGDGDIDIFVGNTNLGAPAIPPQIWLNDGTAHFTAASNALPAAQATLSQNSYTASEFVDVNGDGAVDLVLGGESRTPNSVVLVNDGAGHFTLLQNALPAKPFAPTDFILDIRGADLNRDGKQDLVFAVRIHFPLQGRWLQILINNGNGTFRDESTQRLPQADNTNTWFVGVSLVDIDGDGNLDLIGHVPYLNGNGDYLFALGDSNGVFTPVALVPGLLDRAFTLVDVAGDGHRDFLTLDSVTAVLPNTGAVLPPGIPQHVRAASMPDRVRVTWPYVWGATRYEVWRSTTANTPGVLLGTTTVTMFDDLTATTTPRYYSVYAANGTATSGRSAEITGATAVAPDVTTTAATSITVTGATLNATVEPHGSNTATVFQFGLTSAYGSQAFAPLSVSGTSPVNVSAVATGLLCNSTYHYRAVVTSAGGLANGADITFTTAACPPPTLRPYGVVEDLAWDQAADVDFLIDKMVAAGVQHVRMPFRWYMIEPTNDQWAFGVHDQIVSKLRAKGIEILGLLQHPPAWASGNNAAGTSPPTNDADWQDFVSHVAIRYRGLVSSWEVWNEENLLVFFTPHPDPVRYVQLLKVAFNAIRAADPNATVVLGGLGGNGVDTGWEKPEERFFLQRIYDNGGRNYFDVVAIHPYVHPVTLGVAHLQALVKDTRDVMAANGDAGKRLWLTEIGWTVDPAYVPPITETDQANWVSAVYNARASLGAERIYWYELHELYAPPVDVGWGLVRHDLSLRPLFYAYKAVTSSPPTIKSHPSGQSVTPGHAATLTVAATGTEPLQYQWYAGVAGNTANPISGATSNSFTTPLLTNTTTYWVRVSNAFAPAANSTTATVTVTVGTPGDSDGDGLPDAWEVTYGLDPASSAGNDGASGDPDQDGASNQAEFAAGTHPRGVVRRFFAEGATSTFFETRLAYLNPGDQAASVLTTFEMPDGSKKTQQMTLPARGSVTVVVNDVPGMSKAEFSTRVESDQLLVVDRTMSWDLVDAYGAHAETAVLAPALTWYLAEGSTVGGFNLFYLLQNPNPAEAEVRVRYLRPSGSPLEKTYSLPPGSRTNIWVNQEEFAGAGKALASSDVSAVLDVINNQPIIVERALYLDIPGQTFGAGHESAGVTAPATQWFLAEGATGPFLDLFVLLANPNDTPAQVEASYLLPDGTVIRKSYTVGATSRFNIWVDYEDPRLANTAVSTTVTSTNQLPIIVERAMWWPDGHWYEAHNSPGATSTGVKWALAEGEAGGARGVSTYILLANTSPNVGTITVTLLLQGGGSLEKTFTVNANSRFNVDVAAEFPAAVGKRFGAIVQSVGAVPVQIVVERAMYWDARGQTWAAGTNALGTKLQ